MDEFSKKHALGLADHLKTWADPWVPFIAEAKNDAHPPDYDYFVVTSNWSLEELFGDDD